MTRVCGGPFCLFHGSSEKLGDTLHGNTTQHVMRIFWSAKKITQHTDTVGPSARQWEPWPTQQLGPESDWRKGIILEDSMALVAMNDVTFTNLQRVYCRLSMQLCMLGSDARQPQRFFEHAFCIVLHYQVYDLL